MNHTDIAARLQKITTRLDEISDRLPLEIGRHLGEWYTSNADKCVTEEPSVTASLGTRLSTLKKEITAVAEGIPEQVRQALAPSSRLWVHRSGFDIQVVAVNHKPGQMPEALISELEPHTSTLLSETLARYGFRAQHIPLTFPREVVAAASEYVSLVREQRRFMIELERAGAREKAAELWKKA